MIASIVPSIHPSIHFWLLYYLLSNMRTHENRLKAVNHFLGKSYVGRALLQDSCWQEIYNMRTDYELSIIS